MFFYGFCLLRERFVSSDMDSLTTESQPHENEIPECWDDDDDLQFNDNLALRAASSTGSVTNSSCRPSGHRDSISSRQSARSDSESNAGDQDWQVLLHDNDEISKKEALASAKNAGIPLPANIPNSALLGGKIKRLSSRRPKRAFVDDWSDDVEFPSPHAMLELKTPQDTTFPESIPQVSSTVASPVRSTASPSWNENISLRLKPTLAGLDRFPDQKDDSPNSDFPANKAPIPSQSPYRMATNVQRNNQPAQQESDDFDQDLEFPSDSQPLELPVRKGDTEISNSCLDDFDLEWSEGSIGVRVGGTARDSRSVPSSSMSIASPSVSSCLTGESEDDGLDGIVLPDGPLDFNKSLRKHREADAIDVSPCPGARQDLPSMSDADDFFSGIEVDSGRVFASGRLSLNPNVRYNTEWPASPTRRPATTLTFTNSNISPRTRIPRLSGHERTHSTHLETVSESGAPLSKFQRPQSRLAHSSQSSSSSMSGTAALSLSPAQITSGPRMLGTRIARNTTPVRESQAPARHLRTERSLPAICGVRTASPARTSQTWASHQDGPIRSHNRPNTPVELTTVDARFSARRIPAPFIPDVSGRQPHNPSVKAYRPSRRVNSGSFDDVLNPQDSLSRLSQSTRTGTLRLSLGDTSSERASQTDKRTLTRPTRRRNFGDGTELESFDDLPTSVSAESKYVKNPAGRGAPRSVRTRLSQSRIVPAGESPTHTSTPFSFNQTPRFARDTNASRNAREQRIASMNARNRDTTPLGSFNSNWKAHTVSRTSPSTAPIRSRKPKSAAKAPSKPHLIKPMGSGVQEAKCKVPREMTCNSWTQLTRIFSCWWHAVQPGDFPLGRERKPGAGFRHFHCTQIPKARTHYQRRYHAQCAECWWNDL